MTFPENLRYTKDHEWISFDGSVATIGITDFAQSELGDIVYVDLEDVGSEFDQDEVFGSVEAVKTVSDLFMPIKGEVIEHNEELEDNPQLINESPYDKGWMIKVKVENPSDVESLLTSSAYQEMVGQ
ncbi:MAG: glycine cleavage system protein GcvH [Rhodothermaceae bacterium]|nr:glycine cleavage system protein GcvH [Rhodothermaceae bacterium]